MNDKKCIWIVCFVVCYSIIETVAHQLQGHPTDVLSVHSHQKAAGHLTTFSPVHDTSCHSLLHHWTMNSCCVMCYFYRFARRRHLPPSFPTAVTFAEWSVDACQHVLIVWLEDSECMLAMGQLIWREQQYLSDLVGNGGRQTVPMASLTYCVLWLADTLMTLPQDCSYTHWRRPMHTHTLTDIDIDDQTIDRGHGWSTFGVCTITCAIVYAGTAVHTARLLTCLPLPFPFSNFNWPVIGESAQTATNSA